MLGASPDIRPAARDAAVALLAAVRGAGRVLLTGPVAPDGDSIGACLALANGLRAMTATTVDVAGQVSYRYAWMPGAEAMIPDDGLRGPYDLVVVLDGDARRLEPPVAAAFRAAGMRAIIDHHRSTKVDGYDIALVDPSASSTCDLVFELLVAWRLPLDRPTAQLIYAGVVFDTGGFRHSNTTPQTHLLAAHLVAQGIDHAAISTRILFDRSQAGVALLAAVLSGAEYRSRGRLAIGQASYALGSGLGAGPGDIEGIVDHLVYTSGVELACFFIEQEPGAIKLSLRSRALIDVSIIARSLSPGGGGHARAAGATLNGTVEQVIAQVLPSLEAAVAALPG